MDQIRDGEPVPVLTYPELDDLSLLLVLIFRIKMLEITYTHTCTHRHFFFIPFSLSTPPIACCFLCD